MLSNRPYLLRAFYQWIVDSACTPILVMDAKNPRCKIPLDYAESGEIVFNIAPAAVRDLKINNDIVEFKASFSGVIHIISAPVKAVLAVYAEENGEGIFFDAEEDDGDVSGTTGMVAFKKDGMDIDNLESSLEQSMNPIPLVKNKPVLKLVE